MPTVSDDKSFITFTEEEAAAFAGAGGPDLAYLDELINNYALAQGGEILAVWECVQGPRMGKQVKWSPNRIAEHVGITQSTMNEIRHDGCCLASMDSQPSGPRSRSWSPIRARAAQTLPPGKRTSAG